MNSVFPLSFGSAGALPAKEPPLALTDQRVDWSVRRDSDNAKDGTSADRALLQTFSGGRAEIRNPKFEIRNFNGGRAEIHNPKSKIQNPEVGRAAIPNFEFRIPNSNP
jgi:hypothetical protein